MTYKQPRSIQVVIFTGTSSLRRYLLLRRLSDHGGFWQSVTGSLEGGETHEQAAIREVREETGILACEEQLIDLGLTNTFRIAPQWLPKYAPGVVENEEVCFALRVSPCDVIIDSLEHEEFVWEPYERAIEMLYWESNKRAFAVARLIQD